VRGDAPKGQSDTNPNYRREHGLPNIVFVLLDQCRWDALGAYGNDIIDTPNIDRLAQRGTRFDQFIAPASVCMPIRAAMITSRFPSCNGVRSNGIPLPTTEVTFTQMLQRAGYHTGVIGKLHLVPKKIRRAYLPHPSYGFNTMLLAEGEQNPTGFGHVDFADPVVNCPDDYNQWLEQRAPEVFRSLMQTPYVYRAMVSPCPEELHQATWVTDRAIEFLENRSADSRRFYLNVSYFDPHPNFDPPEEFSRMYDWRDMPPPVRREGEHDEKPTAPDTRGIIESLKCQGLDEEEWRKMRAAYYGQISFVDKQIGRIYQRLRELDLLDNTLIVFCSDHGEMAGDHDLVEKGPYHYDPAIRVPLVLSWPGRIDEGRAVSELVQHVDLAPTFLEAAGVAPAAGMQGRSLIPIANGREEGYETTLTQEYGMLSLWPGVRQLTLRTDRYRFTHHHEEALGELYDLQEDPHELRNLYEQSAYASTLADLKDALLDKVIQVEDPLPDFETEY
jgi:arylsulfatase